MVFTFMKKSPNSKWMKERKKIKAKKFWKEKRR